MKPRPGNVLVNVDVPELAEGEAFYTRALDFRLSRRLGEGLLELEGHGVHLYLLQKELGSLPFASARSPQSARSYERHWSPVHLDFVVERLEGAVERAQESGAILEGEIESADWGRIAHLSDPFGNGFCLIEFSEAGYDALVR